jgi:uncharacterized phiE125 gp8 family phage protein
VIHRGEPEPRRTALICLSPGEAIVSLDDAKTHLRVDTTDDDDYITALCATATARFDGGDGYLKRALLSQQWRLVIPRFHHCYHHRHAHGAHANRIDIPLPPLISIDAVKYLDPDGVQQTLDPADYRAINCGTEESFIIPATGMNWPAISCAPDAVQIEFTAGYGDATDDVPAQIVVAAKLLMAQWYDMRMGIIAQNAIPYELPNGIKDLVANYRIIRF